MRRSFLILATAAAMAAQQPVLTTNGGAPVGDNRNSKTAGEPGGVLLEDIHLIEKLASFDRERIPERVVHARGVGAHGIFTPSADLSAYTKAAFLGPNAKPVPVFVRFSTVIHGGHSPETLRDPRGFAVKFYTDQGNYDIVGNNLPVFFIRDAMQFPDMVHSLKPSPVDNRQDPNRFFDFFSHVPESTHMLTQLYSDMGIPANYRQMDGFGVHAFKWVNASGEVRYVKYHWRSRQGKKNLSAKEAAMIQTSEFQHATADLYEQVGKGNHPAWDLYVQLLPAADLDKFAFNPLDATKIWPEAQLPALKAGTLVLNRMPDRYFDETEQSAFSPGNLVPGIEASEDRLLQGRLFAYFDTQRYRVGPNFQLLPINRPLTDVHSHNQDGSMSMRTSRAGVNYQPSRGASRAFRDDSAQKYSSSPLHGATLQRAIAKQDNFSQAGALYRSFSEPEKASLIANLAGDLGMVKNMEIRAQMVRHFFLADKDYGSRLAKAVGVPLSEVAQ